MPNYKLRKWQRGDERSLAENANNPNIWNNVRDYFPSPYTLTDAYEWINFAQTERCNFAIEVEGKAVGGIGIIFQKDVARRNAEIGYWLGETHWGKGIVSAAIIEMVGYVFESFPEINRIYAGVFQYNTASMRVLEKAGFEQEAILKEAVTKNNQLWDEHIFAIRRTQWVKQHTAK